MLCVWVWGIAWLHADALTVLRTRGEAVQFSITTLMSDRFNGVLEELSPYWSGAGF